MLFTILALYLIVSVESSNETTATYKEVATVSDRTFLWQKPSHSALHCSCLCEIDTGCNSFFYNADGSSCEGNQANVFNTNTEVGTNFYAKVSGNCLPNFSEYQGKCYRVFDFGVTWDDAWQQCKDIDADLLYINSADVQTHIVNLLTNGNYQQRRFWIGHTYSTTSEIWQWTDRHGTNSILEFFSWRPKEPNYIGVENCVQLYELSDWNWHNDRCSSILGFICQTTVF